MLIIYGADFSSPSNKVRYAANCLSLKYEYKRVNLRKGEHLTPEFRKLHPAAKIPVIDDDGFVLFESDAIVRYLADKAGSDLYPGDIRQRAIVNQWMDFVTIHIGGAMNRVIFNRIVAPLINADIDENSLKDGLNFLERFWPVVENRLSTQAFLAGEHLTLADINLLAVTDPVEKTGVDLASYPALTKWRDTIRQRDFCAAFAEERETAAKRLQKEAGKR